MSQQGNPPMPDMTSVANETLTLKAVAAEARRPEPQP